jgi:trk system potassium uptake protein TrkH
MDVVLTVTALAAAWALVWQYAGFELQAAQRDRLHLVTSLVVAIFAMDRLARLMLVEGRRDYLRENWIDFALLAGTLVLALVSPLLRTRAISAAALYVVILQGYLLAKALGTRTSREAPAPAAETTADDRGGLRRRLSALCSQPAAMLVAGFFLLTLAGTGLLMLPVAAVAGKTLQLHDALFTAVSACCLAGLSVRDIGTDLTPFGQAVVLGLIQLGGLAILIFGAILAIQLRRAWSPQPPEATLPLDSAAPAASVRRSVWFVLIVTLGLEAVGAVLAYPMFAAAAASPLKAAWESVFHSVSAFCNCGLSLYNSSLAGIRDGVALPLRDHWQVLGVLAPLIVLGGLGMPVLMDLAAAGKAMALSMFARPVGPLGLAAPEARQPGLSSYSRLILLTTAALVVIGAVGLIAVEPAGEQGRYGAIGRTPVYYDFTRNLHDWPRMSSDQRWRQAAFESISARSAGLTTIDVAELSDAGKWWMCGLMIVGGSPGGAAGGMTTLVVAVLGAAGWSAIRRRDGASIPGRLLPAGLLGAAVAAALFQLLLVGLITLLLCMTMRSGYSFMDLFFEACSACGEVGFSTGITANLSIPAKFILVLGMFLGRVGGPAILLTGLRLPRRR